MAAHNPHISPTQLYIIKYTHSIQQTPFSDAFLFLFTPLVFFFLFPFIFIRIFRASLAFGKLSISLPPVSFSSGSSRTPRRRAVSGRQPCVAGRREAPVVPRGVRPELPPRLVSAERRLAVSPTAY